MKNNNKNYAQLRVVNKDGSLRSPKRPRPRLARKRRAVHGHKLFNRQHLSSTPNSLNDLFPVLMIDSLSRPTLPEHPFPESGVLGHINDGGPNSEDIFDGFHRPFISLDYKSINSRTTLPVTGGGGVGTMRPMSRTVTPTQFKKGFCQRLQAARIRAGLEQADIAKALGIQPNTYSKYESRTLMPHHLIPATCELLAVDMDYLYGEMHRRRKAAVGDLYAP